MRQGAMVEPEIKSDEIEDLKVVGIMRYNHRRGIYEMVVNGEVVADNY